MDTADLARRYCPECEPETDPLKNILVVSWCEPHRPRMQGIDDDVVRLGAYDLPAGEADGHTCRAFAELMEDQEHGRGH